MSIPATRQQEKRLPGSTSKRLVSFQLTSHPTQPFLPRLSLCSYTHRNNLIRKIKRCTISIISPIIIPPKPESRIPRLPD